MENSEQKFLEANIFSDVKIALNHFNKLTTENDQKKFIDDFAKTEEYSEQFTGFVKKLNKEQLNKFNVYYTNTEYAFLPIEEDIKIIKAIFNKRVKLYPPKYRKIEYLVAPNAKNKYPHTTSRSSN